MSTQTHLCGVKQRSPPPSLLVTCLCLKRVGQLARVLQALSWALKCEASDQDCAKELEQRTIEGSVFRGCTRESRHYTNLEDLQ
jgi:hypothetical protein